VRLHDGKSADLTNKDHHLNMMMENQEDHPLPYDRPQPLPSFKHRVFQHYQLTPDIQHQQKNGNPKVAAYPPPHRFPPP
jgi:hypothetical protein